MPSVWATAVVSCLLAAASWADARQDEGTLIFILAGQSNMAGQGDSSELPENLAPVPSNVVFYRNGALADFTGRPRFGPEVTFAHELSAAYPTRSIVLVKFAIGGTSLLAWAPDWSAEAAAVTGNESVGPLYERLMEHVSSALSAHQENAHVAGVLWMQGERDARFPIAGEQYGANLSAFVERLRSDLGAPEAPFIFGQVDPPASLYPASDSVRRAQRAAQRLIPAATMVSTENLAKHEDDLHYNTVGQLELGRRFAIAYLRLQRQ